MCQTKPGMRCSRHANQALKTSYARVLKAKAADEKNHTLEKVKLLREAEEAHRFSVDMYFASPIIFKQLAVTSEQHAMAEYLNLNLNKALLKGDDSNPNTPLALGNRISIRKEGITKNPDSSITVVRSRKNSVTIWNKSDPYHLDTYSREGKLIKSLNLKDDNKTFGFETHASPDIHWAIWYSRKHLRKG